MIDLRKRCLFLFGLWSCLHGALVAAFTEQVLPVPIYVESTEVLTDLHLAVRTEELGLPLVDRTPSADPDLERMLGFFEAVVAHQWDEAAAATLAAPNTSPEQLLQVFEGYAGLVDEVVPEVKIERVVELGTDRLLVWSMPLDAPDSGYDRLVRSFRFLRQGPEGALMFEGTRRDPLAILITSMYQEIQSLGGAVPPVSSQDFTYSYDFPIENNGEPPRFLFNGSIVDADLFGGAPASPEPAPLAFYRQAMAALATGDPAQLAPFFAPESRSVFEQWVAQMEPGEYIAYRDDMMFIGKEAYFVLNADPVYLIFHLPTYEGVTGASFRYDVVWRSPADEWQVVNFFIEGFFDDIVKNRALFEEPFLRPTLIAAGMIEDERAPLTIQAPVAGGPSPPRGPPSTAVASVGPTGDGGDATTGLPRWVWGVVGLLVLLLAYYFWRQRASTSDANASSS